MAGEKRVFRHDDGGIGRSDEKQIQRQGAFGSRWLEPGFGRREIIRAKWMVNEHRPT